MWEGFGLERGVAMTYFGTKTSQGALFIAIHAILNIFKSKYFSSSCGEGVKQGRSSPSPPMG